MPLFLYVKKAKLNPINLQHRLFREESCDEVADILSRSLDA